MKSLLEEFKEDFPDIPLYLRGDSGFVSPDLYEVLEEKDCKYAIRLKENKTLIRLAQEENHVLYRATKFNKADYAVVYGEFLYQAGSWSYPCRVAFKIEKPYGQMIHTYTFIVTTMEELAPYQVLQFYCVRKMRIDTIRLKLLKVAAKVVRSAQYKYFKLCSSCPYKKEFYETLANIQRLQPKLC